MLRKLESGNLFIYLLTDGTSLVNYKRIVSELENSLVYGGGILLVNNLRFSSCGICCD